jgi:hypothetical protein
VGELREKNEISKEKADVALPRGLEQLFSINGLSKSGTLICPIEAQGFFASCVPPGRRRSRGSRSKLQELAVALLHEDFAEHGADVIRRVRERKPEVYLASVVSLLPKRTERIESPLVLESAVGV